jgi:xanthine/CO dehydrogenase XdhC/CoxF family maturation factor
MDRRQTREALRLLESHQPFVRASVVKTTGSVPGKLGASMIVRADGSTMGTVGGAALEEEVKALAHGVFESRVGDLHHFDLQAWTPGGLPSLCGGSVESRSSTSRHDRTCCSGAADMWPTPWPPSSPARVRL